MPKYTSQIYSTVDGSQTIVGAIERDAVSGAAVITSEVAGNANRAFEDLRVAVQNGAATLQLWLSENPDYTLSSAVWNQ